MSRGRNELLRFIFGLVMLGVGLYLFSTNVTVTTGFYSWRIGSFRAGGLVIVPLIVGIIWLFMDSTSFFAKVITALGVVIILASVIMGTSFYFRSVSLYEYIIMLVFIFGGAGLLLSVLFKKKKKKDDDEDE